MHEIAQIAHVGPNAQNSLAAGALPQTPLREITTLPKPLSQWWGVNSLLRHLPLDAFSILLRLRRLRFMCPSQNNYLDPPLPPCTFALRRTVVWRQRIVLLSLVLNIIPLWNASKSPGKSKHTTRQHKLLNCCTENISQTTVIYRRVIVS